MTFFTTALRVLVCTIIALAFLSSTDSVSLADANSSNGLSYVEQEDLAQIIRTRNVDQILYSLNQVKQMRYQGDILPYLLDLWDLRQDKHPTLPWDVISLDIVRLDIGNVLAQATRNGLIQADEIAIHDFAVSLIDSTDVDVAGNALWTLSIFDREQDVSEIKRVALTRRGKPFYLAVMALSNMCNDSAAKAIEKLRSAELTKEQLTFIVDRIQQSADFKERTGSCKESSE